MKNRSKLWLIPAALLVVAGIVSLIAQHFILPGDVEPGDWAEPAQYVLDNLEESDAIAVAPAWNEDPLPFLVTAGDQVLRQNQPLLEDVYERDTVWLLAETDRLDQALAQLPYEAADTKSFGDVSVARLESPDQPRITYELYNHIADARVAHVAGDENVQECKNWDARKQRWYCGRPDKWIYVGPTYLDIGGDPHQCIWAHPPPGQKRLRMTFADVPLGQTFRFRGGLNQRGSRTRRGTDVHVEISVADETKRQTVPANETSWEPVDFDTAQWSGKSRDVTIEVWSESVFDRFYCLNGWVLQE